MSQFRRLEKKPIALCLLCVFDSLRERTTFKSVVACSQVNRDKDPAEEHEDEYGFDYLRERTTFKSVVACSQVNWDEDPAEEHEDEYGVHLIGGNSDARGSTRASQA